MHMDFNVFNNRKISNCQTPNDAPRFLLIICNILLITFYKSSYPASTAHLLKAKTALLCALLYTQGLFMAGTR